MISEKMFQILATLITGGENGEPIASAIDAVTIENLIYIAAPDTYLGSESCVYKNLIKLKDMGFVKTGITRGRQYTYFITDEGMAFVENA